MKPLTQEDRAHVGDRILADRYFRTDGLSPVCIVALAGKGNDWAAYIGSGLPDESREDVAIRVCRYGDKLVRSEALAFFPNMVKSSLTYRR